MKLTLRLVVWMMVALGVARAADDTAKFYGQWKTSVKVNGQVVTIISVHDETGYTNYLVTPTGPMPAGSGAFHAANGLWTAAAAAPNNAGTYLFTGKSAVVCTNTAGQTVTWMRDTTPLPNAGGAAPAPATAPDGNAQPGPKAGTESEVETPTAPPETEPDPSLPPATRAAIVAFNKKDYRTAWDNFMTGARQGDAEAEAGLGAMLFNNINPPGTGYYAQAEHWLQLSANHGNAKGMDFLAQFNYRNATNIAGGINPGVNHTRIPPQEQAQADALFKKARMWFERSAEKGDGYAQANLAIMLDAGVGGPADPQRAIELRAEVKKMSDPNFVKKATANPEAQAMTAVWQSGHYEDAIKGARARAEQGNATAQALLGRAYYEGLGVPRNYREAKQWLEKAVAQNQPDGMFFLGLMYEYARGVEEDPKKALDLFDRATALGQHYADMEAHGMRMAIELQKAKYHPKGGVEDTACGVAGGSMVGFECIRGGSTIDPFAPWKNEEN